MGRVAPHVVALRDQLLAILRDNPEGLDMRQVLAKLGGTNWDRGIYYSRVYAQLRAMDRLGLVVWHDWMGWSCGCNPREEGQAGYAVHHQAVHFIATPYDTESGITLPDLEALLVDEPYEGPHI